MPPSVTRFGLVYVLVAVWVAAVIVLPSRPLPEVGDSVGGPAAGDVSGPSLVPGATADTLPADATATHGAAGGAGPRGSRRRAAGTGRHQGRGRLCGGRPPGARGHLLAAVHPRLRR